MIPLELLKPTGSRALGFCVYGGPGTKKTFAVHTLPPPICLLEFEGGEASILPWTRRTRAWNGSWKEYTQKEREAMLVAGESSIKPAPLVDVIGFDNTDPESYETLVKVVGEFPVKMYNSVVIDPLYELAVETQAITKHKAGHGLMEPFPGGLLWGPAQERAGILLRKLRNYRDLGVFVYMISSEQIDKDYVKDPRSSKPGEHAQEPYSVKGTCNVPGKLVNVVQHMTDVQIHSRQLNGEVTWVTKPEPLPGGTAVWEAKDRTGRIAEGYMKPSFRAMCLQIYGEEAPRIYAAGREPEVGISDES